MRQKLIRTVIVDDDVLALTTLKMLIQVEHIKIAGEFTQAEQAIAYIEKHPVELLITDMKMPRVDGIALIKSAKEYKPDIEIIAVSSYKDFNYVKESFREGSVDYILKHLLNEEVLTHALLEASKRIFSKKEETEIEEETYMESKEALKEKIFGQLFRSEVTAQKVEETMKRHNISLDVGSCVVVVCEIDDYEKTVERFGQEDMRIFSEAFRGIIEKVLEKVPEKVIIPIQDGSYGILLSFTGVKSQIYVFSMAAQYSKRLNENIKKLMDVELSVSMGNLCSSVQNIKTSFEQCISLLKNKFTQGKGQVYGGYPVRGEKNSGQIPVQGSQEAVVFHGEDILNRLMAADESCMQTVEEIFDYYKRRKFPKSVVEMNIVEMLNTGCRVVSAKKLELLKATDSFQILYSRAAKTETVDEVKAIVLEFYDSILTELGRLLSMQEKQYNKHTVNALRYMEAHYTEMISLQEVAEKLGVHYAYLSKTFKTDMKCGFTEHLNKIRIEKAKELIHSSQYKIKEIYPMAGFNQYNYFFKVFKQLEGCTPAEYDKNVKKIE